MLIYDQLESALGRGESGVQVQQVSDTEWSACIGLSPVQVVLYICGLPSLDHMLRRR